MKKRGISAIVATVLIILITVAAVSVVWVFVLPIVNNIDSSFQIVDLKFSSLDGYMVWDIDNRLLEVQVERGSDDAEIEGVVLYFVFDDGTVKHYINEDVGVNDKRVYHLNLSNYTGSLIKVKLAPIFSGGKEGEVVSELLVGEIRTGDLSTGSGVYASPNGGSSSGGGSGGCSPDCAGKVCGDDGCGGSCGVCDSGASCVDGVCVEGGCEEDWSCSEFGVCVEETQNRTCVDLNGCGTVLEKPEVSQSCVEVVLTGDEIFVDNQLVEDCVGNYSVAERDCSGEDGDGYVYPQDAANIVEAGDTIYIREGNYYDSAPRCGSSGFCELIHLTTSGSEINPIVIQNYKDEEVIFVGFGFSDEDSNGDGLADGPPSSVDGKSVDRENLIIIEADYVNVRGLKLINSSQVGISIRGSNNVVENMEISDCWGGGVMIGFLTIDTKIVENNIVKNIEIKNIRHGYGVKLGRTDEGTSNTYLNYTKKNIIENCLSYNNGYLPNGTKVLPVPGDAAGGGNSDGFMAYKRCSDGATLEVPNWCPENIFRNNIGFGNADDGMDVSFADSIVEGNIMFNNGPEGRRGFKVYADTYNLTYRGNIAFSNLGTGFELRIISGERFYVYNNLAIYNGNYGFLGVRASNSEIYNNLGAFSSSTDLMNFGICTNCLNNWAEDVDGNPKLVDDNVVIDTDFPTRLNFLQKMDFIRSQFKVAFTPALGSSLIDAGVVIPGYHCATAGDTGDCVTWYGSAPDIGAYEYV